jgi:predicted MPP superfamily phosphohydrolase
MRSLPGFIVFLSVLLLVLGGGHYYLWARLVRDPSWGEPWRAIGTAIFVALPLGIVIGGILFRGLSRPLSAFLFTWMGVALFLMMSFFAIDLAQAVLRLWQLVRGGVPGGEELADPARRQLLARSFAGAASATAVALSGASIRSGLGEVELREVEVKLPRLPKALSNLTLTQLSDVHIGSTVMKPKDIAALVEKTNATKPDAIVITGDLIDGSVERLLEHVAPLARLSARYGVYFVTGNHEYYSGVGPWVQHLRKLGIRVLSNERVQLGDDGASIDLAGVDDSSADPDYARAFAGRDPERELVLLAHQPKQIEAAASAGVGLQISGHTHGGQIWPFTELVRLAQPYVAGLYRHNERTQIYVSRGTGYWGPPMRLFAPAELTKITLT